MPSAERLGELVPRLIGQGVWDIYKDLAPDFTALVEPRYAEAEDLIEGYRCADERAAGPRRAQGGR